MKIELLSSSLNVITYWPLNSLLSIFILLKNLIDERIYIKSKYYET